MRGVKTEKSGRWKKYGIFLFLVVILVFLTNSTRKVYEKKMEAEKKLAYMMAELQALEERQETLSSSLQRLETEEGLEFEMRRKLNVAEAGESVAVIVDEKEENPTTQPKNSFWQRLKSFWSDLLE